MNIHQRIKELSSLDVREILRSPVKERSEKKRLGVFLSSSGSKEDLAFASITIGDLIYDVSRVDPTVMEGIDFARAVDLSNVFKFGQFAKNLKGLSGRVYDGNISQLQGYVAERLVAQHLQSQGFEVEFPHDSNQAGYDLLVNGTPSQVKCLENTSGVGEHLGKYPDIPVYVNGELADKLSNKENVFPIPGISHDEVVQATKDSLDAGAEIFDFEIPMIAITVASGKELLAMINRKTDLISALQNVAVDTTGRVFVGTAGSKALATAGLVLGPYGVVIGGLTGAVLGARQGRKLASWIKANVLCAKEEEGVQKSLSELLLKVFKEAGIKLEIMKRKFDLLEFNMKNGGKLKATIWEDFEWRMTQEMEYVKNKIQQIKKYMRDPRSLDIQNREILTAAVEGRLLVIQTGIPEHNISRELKKLSKSIEKLNKARERYSLK